jgi:hypothetical protein
MTLNIPKIAVVGSFAAGAALALAPLAAADPLTPTVDSEIASLNALFESEAALAGDSADVVHHAGSFDTIPLADAPLNGTGTLDALLYGVDPLEAGPASDPGSYNVFNGALTEFSDAYNVELYALLNNGALMPDATAATDLFGSATTIDNALDLGTASQAADFFFNFGLGDLSGFFDVS